MTQKIHFVPDTEQVRGLIHGYDQQNQGVTRENVEAVIREFLDYDDLVMNGATESWPEFWKYVNRSQMFWWKYYCGQTTAVKTRLEGMKSGDEIREWHFGDAEAIDARKGR